MHARWCFGLGLALAVGACRKADAPPPPPPAAKVQAVQAAKTVCPTPRLDAHRLATPLVFDGHLDEAPWRETQSTGAFLLEGEGTFTSPHSELRALWNKDALVLGLYGADEDLRDDDAFTVRLDAGGPLLVLRVTAGGSVSCVGGCELPAGITVAVDADGTLGDPTDYDEEWLVELSIPWAALGASAPVKELKLNASRTDTPKGATPRTTTWACAAPTALGRVSLR